MRLAHPPGGFLRVPRRTCRGTCFAPDLPVCPSDSSHLKRLPASGRIPREDVCDHFRFTLDAEVKTHANVGSIMHLFPPKKEMLKSYPQHLKRDRL